MSALNQFAFAPSHDPTRLAAEALFVGGRLTGRTGEADHAL